MRIKMQHYKDEKRCPDCDKKTKNIYTLVEADGTRKYCACAECMMDFLTDTSVEITVR